MAVEIKMLPIDKIRPAPFQPRETFEKEKIAELAESIKEMDLINPIVVRKEGNSYQIIAGERRWRAWHNTGKKEIPAIIREANTMEAMELSLIENWQREDLSDPEKQKFVYQLWKDGNKAGRYKDIAEMSKKTGIDRVSLSRYIEAGDEKHAKNAFKYIKQATSTDLYLTRVLEETAPEAREELLKLRVEKPEKLGQVELREVVKAVKEAPKETRKALVKLISEEKLEPKNAETFVKTLKEASEDIQEKLIKQEITPEEAEEVKIFKTPEQRSQIIEEKKILRQDFKDQEQRHVAVRKKMADDMEAGKKPTQIHTRFDLTGRDDEASAKRTLERYQNIHLEVLSYRADHILSIKNKDMQDQCIEIVKRTLTHCNEVLQKVNGLKLLIK